MQGFPVNPRSRLVVRTRAFTLLYTGLVMTVLAGFASFAVDWGRVQLCKTELQRAADAAARAGASQLPLGVAAVQTAAVSLASYNSADNTSVVIDPNNDVDFGTWDSTAKTFTVLTGTARSSANSIRVTARRISSRGNAVPLLFGQIVGVSSYDATKSSIAIYTGASIDFSGGFSGATSLNQVGGAIINGSALRLTTSTANAANASWYSTKVPVNEFNCVFTFQLSSATADGFTFCMQNKSSTAVGGSGGGLGFSGMTTSVAVKFDIYNNSGEGVSSTGVYINGASPYNVSSYDMTSANVLLKSGHIMKCTLSYDGLTLTETVLDTSTNASFTQSYVVNIPTTVGASNAYIGFTAGTGGSTATQNILTWTYTGPGSLAYVK